MSEERLANIETRLTSVKTKVNDLDTKVDDLSAKFDGFGPKFDAIDARFDAVDARFDAVDARFDAVDARFDDLGHQMRLLHEDTIDKIRALAPDFGPVRREFAAADAKLRDEIDQRLVPLEAIARTRRKSPPN